MKCRFNSDEGDTRLYDLGSETDRLNAYFELRSLHEGGALTRNKFAFYLFKLQKSGLRLMHTEDVERANEFGWFVKLAKGKGEARDDRGLEEAA